MTEDTNEEKRDKEHINHVLKGSGIPQSCFIDTVEDFLVCSICLDVVRDPPNLNCPHLFCRKCIDKCIEERCPTCRKEFNVNNLITVYSVNQLLWDKNIRCLYHDKGCTWTGKMGLQERNLTDHLKVCEWGGFKKCEKCSIYIYKIDEEDHKSKCIESEAECNYCGEKMKRKMILVHQSIGAISGMLCENICKCRFGCEKYIKKGDVENHEDTECENRISICYACEKMHTIPFYKLLDHMSHQIKTIQDAQKYMERVSGYPIGRIGSVVDVYYSFVRDGMRIGEWRIGEVLSIRDGPESKDFRSNLEDRREFQCRLLDTDEVIWVRCNSIKKVGHYTSKDILIPSVLKMKDIVMNCLKRFECTISVVPPNTYDIQPFYTCNTCSGKHYDNRNGNIGCCAVCASICHQGHDLVLNNVNNRSNCFCDCGSGGMKDAFGRVVPCCAPKSTLNSIEPQVREVGVWRGLSTVNIDLEPSLMVTWGYEDDFVI